MIKRPGNEFNIVDQSSKFNSPTLNTITPSPLLLTAASFDKGKEDLMEISGNDFFKMFGEDISFEKHGQPAIQAANVIRNGGRLLIKRVVADDAELANIIVLATVSKTQVPKLDSETGAQIYIDKDTGGETTESKAADGSLNDKAMINTATIKYSISSVAGAKDIREVKNMAKELLVEKDAETIVIPDPNPSTDGEDETDTSTGEVTEGDGTTEEGGETLKVDSAIPGALPLPIGVVDAGDINGGTTVNTASEYTYPLYVIAENGRGVSTKRFKITPDYAISKNLKFVMYTLTNIGKFNLDQEYTRFTCNPDITYQGVNMSLSESGKDMAQLQALSLNDSIYKFIDRISEFTGMDEDALSGVDILFGKTLRGDDLPQITVDPEGYDLTSDFGIALQNGSNGAFGTHPFGSEEYIDQLVSFYSGEFDPEIFDVEHHKIEACFDCNYPLEVKEEITKLVEFRKDFMFFRDLGLDLESYDAIKLVSKNLKDSMYAANYCQSYDIIDPFSLKQVPVTITYSLAELAIKHFNDSRHCPFCGDIYGVTIPEAIEGTFSFIPRITPTVDQKQQLYDIHMNYGSYQNNLFTLETQIDSQPEETQCSYINNILIIQHIIRVVREKCPRIRYSFIDKSTGLTKYANEIKTVLKQFSTLVDELDFQWSADDIMLANHIFNADIIVKFKNYADYEKFTIYVID